MSNQKGNNKNNEISSSDQIAQRRAKLAEMRKNGNPFRNDFRRDSLSVELKARFGELSKEQLADEPVRVKVAGRMMTRRMMGKASFAHLQDMSGQIQLYVKRDDLPEGRYAEFKRWDIGDILGAEGVMFKTNKGELSVLLDDIHILTKALHPLPEKFHGLSDQETRYRQRYLDLIMNEEARETFKKRSAIVDYIRRYLMDKDFMEVETPMMQVIPGGATAKPFTTHHNALDLQLYLRIAPELYLKRLVVGGFEKVFEINRNFRNEGLSTRHNPEFTMLEWYQAYSDYHDLMDLTENMLRSLAKEVLDSTTVTCEEKDYDLSKPFQRMTVKESILKFNPDLEADQLESLDAIKLVAKDLGIPIKNTYGLGKIQIEIFEKTVEENLDEPTFITAYPTEVSPLARRNGDDPFVTDRFEFFIGGREIANGFSELNDPEDQAERFRKQVEEMEAGDDEAMHFDADYIRALEHGMPPTAGEGIGIDRLVMFLTDSPSIRDVLLFPHMRPKND